MLSKRSPYTHIKCCIMLGRPVVGDVILERNTMQTCNSYTHDVTVITNVRFCSLYGDEQCCYQKLNILFSKVWISRPPEWRCFVNEQPKHTKSFSWKWLSVNSHSETALYSHRFSHTRTGCHWSKKQIVPPQTQHQCWTGHWSGYSNKTTKSLLKASNYSISTI